MSTATQGENTSLLPRESHPEETDVADAPLLTSPPEAPQKDASSAYVGEIVELDVVKSIDLPCDNASEGYGASNHVLLDLKGEPVSYIGGVAETENETDPKVLTDCGEEKDMSMQQSAEGTPYTEGHKELKNDSLPFENSESFEIMAAGTLDALCIDDVCKKCEIHADLVLEKIQEGDPVELSPNMPPNMEHVQQKHDECVENHATDLMHLPAFYDHPVAPCNVTSEDVTAVTNIDKPIKEPIATEDDFSPFENQDFDERNDLKSLDNGIRTGDVKKAIDAEKTDVIYAKDISKNQNTSFGFASDTHHILSSKSSLNINNVDETRNVHKISKVSSKSDAKAYKEPKTIGLHTSDSLPIPSEGYRKTVLPRVASLYKTMKPAREKSRLASRGEIPFIFRQNGSHVYITNYKADIESMLSPRRNSKSKNSAKSSRISQLAVPKYLVTPNITSNAHHECHHDRTASSKPQQDFDDSTLDKLLDEGLPNDTAAKVESDSSPTDVRQIDVVAEYDGAMKPKNLDATEF